MYMYVCLYMYVCICMYVYVCMYMYVCMYVCICMCVRMCMCVCMHTCVCMHNILGGIVRGKCPTQNGRGNCPGGNCPGGIVQGGNILHPVQVMRCRHAVLSCSPPLLALSYCQSQAWTEEEDDANYLCHHTVSFKYSAWYTK